MPRRFTLTRTRSNKPKDIDPNSPRDSPRTEGVISQPVFIATDAQPRDDLYTLQTSHSSTPLERPRTASSPQKRPNQTQSPHARDSPVPSLNLRIPPQSRVVHNAEGHQQEVGIGMALGSPSQNPLPVLPHEPHVIEDNHVSSPQNSATEEPPWYEKDEHRPKGRWKGFGGLFSKKSVSMPVSPASPLYASQTTTQGSSHREIRPHAFSHGSHFTRQIEIPRINRETVQDSPRHLKMPISKYSSFKPEMQRSHTTPMFQPERHTPTPPPPPKDVIHKNNLVQFPVAASSLLEVEIPSVTMDRYSVMFGSVLQPKQPSLLVRRQAQLEKLKDLDEELEQRQREIERLQAQIVTDKTVREKIVNVVIEPEPSYRLEEATLKVPVRGPSPIPPAKSPSFSLFPSTPTARTRDRSPNASRKPTPIQRVSLPPLTAKVNVQPPLKPSLEFKHTESKDQSAMLVMIHSPVQSVDSPASSHRPKWSSDLSPTSTEASLPSESDFLSMDKGSFSVAPETRRLLEARKQATTTPSNDETTLTSKVFEFPAPTERVPPKRIRLTDSPERGPSQVPEQRPEQNRQEVPRKAPKPAPSTPNLKQSRPRAPSNPGLVRTASLTKGHPNQGPLKFTQIKPMLPPSSTPDSKLTSHHHNVTIAPSKTAKTQSESVHVGNGNPLTSSPPSAAEISIARQISVSRRQRQLLVPIVPKTTKQPMQPKLVSVEGVSRHASRKSHHVLVESD